VRLLLIGMAVLAVCACASDPVERAVYDTLRRYEERRPAPGEAPRALPTYDEYKRQRHAERL